MKRLLQVLAIAVVATIGLGYFYKYQKDAATGDRFIGLAILALAFVVMPLFLVYRYRRKNLRDYLFTRKKEGKTPGKDG